VQGTTPLGNGVPQEAHAVGALSATQPVMRGGQDQVDQGRSERGVLCTRVTEDAEMRRSSLSRLVLMAKTVFSLDPIGSVINASVDMRSTTCSDSPRPFSFSLSMGESILDGQSGRTLDCFVVNNSCFNSVAPGDARGAKARAAGPMSRECAYGNDDLFSTGDTKGSSEMRESMRNADKYGHVENAR